MVKQFGVGWCLLCAGSLFLSGCGGGPQQRAGGPGASAMGGPGNAGWRNQQLAQQGSPNPMMPSQTPPPNFPQVGTPVGTPGGAFPTSSNPQPNPALGAATPFPPAAPGNAFSNPRTTTTPVQGPFSTNPATYAPPPGSMPPMNQ
jgi:hypothetical protein